ncbi:ABC transporter substrate-binding protein [Pseudomonas quasicaspiana]|uniref:ABC transporter substrate-binding protein n=1 Tax=Pseudomonas quasicaspiana TaxID=2829821 RepID=UPI001E4A8F3C|nr:ABC transporter substrate-binding protein [Pseudomonas quasicaspiana]MCD5972659.1 ABC transporter substrate-binding protein [Pseudomonas quasicaspiana]
MSEISPAVLADLAPDGVLRAAINFGNPVLAQQAADGSPQGVSVQLAKALAEELGVRLEMVTFDAAGKVFAALEQAAWNVAFLAIEPVRAEQIAFSDPYVAIEGTYLVAADSAFKEVDDLDRSGLRLAVGKGAAYDLYLSRTLQHAELCRAETSAAAVDLFLEQGLDAAAGVRQPLEKFAAAHSGYRVLKGAFTSIRQAMAVPRQRVAGAEFVQRFIERQKANGFVRQALDATGQGDVAVPV